MTAQRGHFEREQEPAQGQDELAAVMRAGAALADELDAIGARFLVTVPVTSARAAKGAAYADAATRVRAVLCADAGRSQQA